MGKGQNVIEDTIPVFQFLAAGESDACNEFASLVQKTDKKHLHNYNEWNSNWFKRRKKIDKKNSRHFHQVYDGRILHRTQYFNQTETHISSL